MHQTLPYPIQKHGVFEISLQKLTAWYRIFKPVYDKHKYYYENNQLVYLLSDIYIYIRTIGI